MLRRALDSEGTYDVCLQSFTPLHFCLICLCKIHAVSFLNSRGMRWAVWLALSSTLESSELGLSGSSRLGVAVMDHVTLKTGSFPIKYTTNTSDRLGGPCTDQPLCHRFPATCMPPKQSIRHSSQRALAPTTDPIRTARLHLSSSETATTF